MFPTDNSSAGSNYEFEWSCYDIVTLLNLERTDLELKKRRHSKFYRPTTKLLLCFNSRFSNVMSIFLRVCGVRRTRATKEGKGEGRRKEEGDEKESG